MQTRPSPSHGGRPILALAAFLILCFAVAAVGAASAAHSIPTWYAGLVKPQFNPPNWIFAPVWTILYTVMAIAAWLVWRTPRRAGRRGSLQSIEDTQGSARLDALVVFGIQLFFNFLWTPIFFHYHRLLVAVVVILALWIAIVATMVLFWRVRPLAGALMLPYLGWVSFAIALNLALLRRN
ncbi:TspO/MBR family protein [Granulicella sp. dw_53]|uniref:TspO/MBR family protein n=1 Tax=Granulicella sp. dw_53 TaxID=2719792 RepID=UPI001BD448CF